jgi:hypothetical protein
LETLGVCAAAASSTDYLALSCPWHPLLLSYSQIICPSCSNIDPGLCQVRCNLSATADRWAAAIPASCLRTVFGWRTCNDVFVHKLGGVVTGHTVLFGRSWRTMTRCRCRRSCRQVILLKARERETSHGSVYECAAIYTKPHRGSYPGSFPVKISALSIELQSATTTLLHPSRVRHQPQNESLLQARDVRNPKRPVATKLGASVLQGIGES